MSVKEVVVKEKKLPSHLARAIHSINAAYLLLVAKTSDCPALDEYVRNEVMVVNESNEWSKVFSTKNQEFNLRKQSFQ
jgi:hypothetical protein